MTVGESNKASRVSADSLRSALSVGQGLVALRLLLLHAAGLDGRLLRADGQEDAEDGEHAERPHQAGQRRRPVHVITSPTRY